MKTLKKQSVAAILSLVLMLSFSMVAYGAPQTTCPVMGGAINKQLYSDYKGQRVYFCCMACPPQFEKDPEKYINKLKEMGQDPEIIQTGN